jgi:hypothetical protein
MTQMLARSSLKAYEEARRRTPQQHQKHPVLLALLKTADAPCTEETPQKNRGSPKKTKRANSDLPLENTFGAPFRFRIEVF